jgi:hypothetical protein
VPVGGGATPTAPGTFGAADPVVASVLEGDHALVPATFTLCNSTSYAVPDVREVSVYGLLAPATVVQVAVPDGLNRRLNEVAASCMLSIAGTVQITVRLLPLCASDGAPGGFAVWGVGGACGAGVVDPDGANGCIVAMGRNGTVGVRGYIDICIADPIVAAWLRDSGYGWKDVSILIFTAPDKIG